MIRSLRARMQIGMLLGTAVAVAIFAVGTYTMIRRALIEEFDASLAVTTRALASTARIDDHRVRISFGIQAIPEFQPSEKAGYFQFWSGDEQVLRRSPSLGEGTLEAFTGEADVLAVREIALPNGRAGRAAGLRFTPAGGRPVDAALPPPAARKMAEAFPDAIIQKVRAENGGDNPVLYKVTCTQDGRDMEVRLMADGTIAQTTMPVASRQLPQVVVDTLARVAPGARIVSVWATTAHVRIEDSGPVALAVPAVSYEVELSHGREKLEARIAADGTLGEIEREDEEGEEDDDHDDDDDGEWSGKQQSRTHDAAGAVVLVVARDASALEARLASLRWVLLAAWGVAMAIALAMTAMIVRRGLKPLSTLASQIGTIREDDLGKRIPPSDMPTELAPVRHRLNELLDRLQAAFKRERRFTADAAHELRTPLAGMRTTIEVAVSRDRPADEHAQSLAECLDIAKHMQSTVECLLMLSRLDANEVTFQHDPVNLGDVIETCWQGQADQARHADLTYHNTVAPDLACLCDASHLAIIFTNLLANAVQYADRGGTINVTARAAVSQVEITVANTGCTLTAEQVSHVFERFWQGDEARSRTGVHSGLGLSLVQRIATGLGGNVSAAVDERGIFSIRLALPCAT